MAAGDASAATIQVSVVIPHYHDLVGLDRCLRGLEVQTFPSDSFEIIVADNDSPEGEAAVTAAIAGRAKLVVCTQRGAGPARNMGVVASRGEILAFIDSDCLPDPRWLEMGVQALQRFDFIGGRVKVLVDDEAAMTPAEAFEAVFAFDFATYINKKGFTGAGNMFCPRRVFDQVGGFDVGVSEDVDWSHRATAAGFRLGYDPQTIIAHPARRTWQELQRKWERVNIETFKLHRKEGRSLLTWLLRCLALPVSAIVHTPKVLMSSELSRGRDRLSALSVLYGTRIWRAVHCAGLVFKSDGAS
jgi:glycosyltransferase involved in cell wall biosynthesis